MMKIPITIDSTSYDLTVNVQNLREFDQYDGTPYLTGVIKFYLQFPAGYRSELTNKLTRDGMPNFGHITTNCVFLRDAEYRDAFDMFSLNEIYIEIFNIYVNDISLKKLATPGELKAMKGIGKKFLCVCLRYLKHTYPEVISDDINVHLQAGGLLTLCDEDFYTAMTAEQLLARLASRPKLQASFQDTATRSLIHHRILAKRVCEIESNEALVNYYRTYGFVTREEEYYVGADMDAKLGTVLGNCG